MKKRDFLKNIISAVAIAVGGINSSFAFTELITIKKFNFMEQMHPNLTLINDFFTAYGNNDYAAIKKVLAEDILWHIPGEHPLSGTKKGIDAVLNFFKALDKGLFKAEPIIMGVNEKFVIDCHRNWSNLEDTENLNAMSCLLWRIENNIIKEVHNFPENQKEVNSFFNKLYSQH